MLNDTNFCLSLVKKNVKFLGIRFRVKVIDAHIKVTLIKYYLSHIDTEFYASSHN